MRGTTRTIVGVSCLWALHLLSSPQGHPQGAGFENLTLEIQALDGPVLPMRALRLLTTLTNQTDQPIRGHDVLEMGAGLLRLYVAGEEGTFYQVHSGIENALRIADPTRELPPGYHRANQTYLWWGRTVEGDARALFPQPGEYLLKTALRNVVGESSVESNVVSVEVIEPEPQDRLAWEFLRTYQIEKDRFFFRAGADPLKEFIVRFPESRYAPYAWYALGDLYSIAKDRVQAAVAFEKAAEDKSFPFRDDVLFTLVDIYLRRARSHAGSLKSDYPGSPLTSEADRLMR